MEKTWKIGFFNGSTLCAGFVRAYDIQAAISRCSVIPGCYPSAIISIEMVPESYNTAQGPF
jgi:hypothetical protein